MTRAVRNDMIINIHDSQSTLLQFLALANDLLSQLILLLRHRPQLLENGRQVNCCFIRLKRAVWQVERITLVQSKWESFELNQLKIFPI